MEWQNGTFAKSSFALPSLLVKPAPASLEALKKRSVIESSDYQGALRDQQGKPPTQLWKYDFLGGKHRTGLCQKPDFSPLKEKEEAIMDIADQSTFLAIELPAVTRPGETYRMRTRKWQICFRVMHVSVR